MAIYSINDLEKISGIKAHTLRIWEQRYGIIRPKRTPANIRFFDDEDLRHLLNIALLNRHGYKISKIAKMSPRDIQAAVATVAEVDHAYATQLDSLTLSVVEMDESKFSRIIDAHIKQSGFEKTMLEVIYPFMEKLSILWLSGSISAVQENFFTHLVRQKLITATETETPSPQIAPKKFLLYLPEGERQELSLLFMNYLVKNRGHRSIYLGLDVSLTDLADAHKICRPDYIFTMITETFAHSPLLPYVKNLLLAFPASKVLLSGYQPIAQNIPSSENLLILKSLQEAIDLLQQLNETAEDQAIPAPSRQI